MQLYGALRRILLWLWEHHGSPKLDGEIPRLAAIRPRNVTVTQDETRMLLEAAKPALKLWLLLCSDIALRSGTAARISGAHYNKETRSLRFVTKGQARQTLPVTEAIASIIDPLDHLSTIPYVWQLWAKETGRKLQKDRSEDNREDVKILRRSLKQLRLQLGIERRIVAHDFRRTTAVALLNKTGDLRTVKALLGHHDLKTTLWYIDHDAAQVDAETLEAIKQPFIIHRRQIA